MNKDKLLNDTTSEKTQFAPIKVAKPSNDIEESNNPHTEGDSSSEHIVKNDPVDSPDKGGNNPGH
ncbi:MULTISPECIES: hypothetical protein [unclassified Nostoc]|uniref:hypothetical protein n=1 Tax=unclassified Nostoc TaxID=2593658 RepID=UPI002AD4147C|nr:hypothetical protein [Nostoc sp. DedQUE03]MDZ7976958.1 hypothetical protein [Nostoc sp. DedQUE03]MDZ8043294.1 hypothetical protein [Nostoc sp. DedQUE02]